MPGSQTTGRFPRFLVSGASATAFHWLLMWLAMLTGIPATPATALGATGGAALNYLLQRNWAFRSAVPHAVAAKRFAVSAAFAWLANLGLFSTLHHGTGLTALISQAATTASVAALTYFLYTRLVFHEATS